MKITSLQDTNSFNQFKSFIHTILHLQKQSILQTIYQDFTNQLQIIKCNQYSESIHHLNSSSFNTDNEICSVPQLRFLFLFSEVIIDWQETWTRSITDSFQWIFSIWCEICQVQNKYLQFLSYEYLIELSVKVKENLQLKEWCFTLLQPIINQHKLMYSLHKEMKNYPLLSKPLQSLFSVFSIYSNQFLSLSIPNTNHVYHFQSHGLMILSKQIIQPSWTLEFWFNLLHQFHEEIVVFNGINQSVRIQDGKFIITVEHQSIFFSLPIELHQWMHLAITVDSITNVLFSFFSLFY